MGRRGKSRDREERKKKKERKEQVIPLGSALSIMAGICVERAWAERQRGQNWRGKKSRSCRNRRASNSSTKGSSAGINIICCSIVPRSVREEQSPACIDARGCRGHTHTNGVYVGLHTRLYIYLFTRPSFPSNKGRARLFQACFSTVSLVWVDFFCAVIFIRQRVRSISRQRLR